MTSTVFSVHSSPTHSMSKTARELITLFEGMGVDGDAHRGETVKHRSRVRRDPTEPNLRQVHLIHSELLDELKLVGLDLVPGSMGENITTSGVDLLGLSAGARLHIGQDAVVEVTGLRNPCSQLDDLMPGLMNAVLGRDPDGELVRKAGVMGIVLASGEVRPGDPIEVMLPEGEHRPMQPV